MSDDETTPIDLLLSHCHYAKHAGLPTAERIAECVNKWLDGDVDTLDEAFGVAAAGQGSTPARKHHFEQLRNDKLDTALGYIEGPNLKARVSELHRRAQVMLADWDELRLLNEPDSAWSGLKASLWWACKHAERAGRPVPGPKRIAAIVDADESRDFPEVTSKAVEPTPE